MKKRLLVILLGLCSIFAVSAQNNTDRAERIQKYFEDDEVISITGKVVLENGEQATITVKGETYTLMAPWHELEELELKNGQTITVNGYEKTARFQWDGKEKMLHVTSITIDGKVTEFDFTMMGGGRDGKRHMDGENKGNRRGGKGR